MEGSKPPAFCWADFGAAKCRGTATAKINDMGKAERADNGHRGKVL